MIPLYRTVHSVAEACLELMSLQNLFLLPKPTNEQSEQPVNKIQVYSPWFEQEINPRRNDPLKQRIYVQINKQGNKQTN